MTLGNDEYSFVYDPTASIPAVVFEVGPDGTAEYYREPDGSLVARIMPESGYGDEMQFYHFDALGNTVLLTRPDGDYGFGRLHQTYYYGAWGETYSYCLPVDNPYQYVGQLGYYTHYQDPTLGMLQLGVRFYEPGTGRFGQRDAVRDWSCVYRYAHNRPTRLVDADGRWPLDTCSTSNRYDPCAKDGTGDCTECNIKLGNRCIKKCQKKYKGCWPWTLILRFQCSKGCSEGATACGNAHCNTESNITGLIECHDLLELSLGL